MKNLLVVVFALFFVVSCAKKEDKKAGEGYLAKVGNVVITKQDMDNELASMPEDRRQFYMGKDGMGQLIEDMVKKEIFHQEAIKKGIDKKQEYLKKIEYLKKMSLIETLLETELAKKIEVTDKEVIDYYNKHKAAEFTDKATGKVIELQYIKDGLKKQLVMEKQRGVFEKYLADLRKTYKPEIKAVDSKQRK